MYVGIIKFSIRLPANQSLKGKRRVVTSLIEKIHHRFTVAIAEVDFNDNLKKACLGISFVSNSTKVIQQVQTKILNYLQSYRGDFILEDYDQEMLDR